MKFLYSVEGIINHEYCISRITSLHENNCLNAVIKTRLCFENCKTYSHVIA